MNNRTSESHLISKLFFRLLPFQIVLNVVGAVNTIVSSLFASNFVGKDAMTAVGLYGPLNMFIFALNGMLVGGALVISGKHIGKNDMERTSQIFSIDIVLSVLLSVVMILLLGVSALTGLTSVFTHDPDILPLLNSYILGQLIGILPLVVGQQLFGFLSLENQNRRTITASIVLIFVNLALNFIFVSLLKWGVFGLALSSSLGMWVFCLMLSQYYISGKSILHFSTKNLIRKDVSDIMLIGMPGALTYAYQTIRGLILNSLMLSFIGSMAVSAFTAADTLLRFFWAIPIGIAAVSRMLMSVSIGEEDRQSLEDVMRTVLFRALPMMCVISGIIIACAEPFTRLYYRDPSDPVYQMTVMGFRILPLCMPLSVICMNFVCYGQVSGKQFLIHLLSLLDGVVCSAGFSAILVPSLGLNGIYIANVLNGVVTTIVIWVYAWIMNRHFPRTISELMVIPADFGVPAEDRIDISVCKIDDVVQVSQNVQEFCLRKGLEKRKAYLAGLCMEEMAGNVIEHGFTKDKRSHSIDIRVVYKPEELILRIKDDCVRFNPGDRLKNVDPTDVTRNIGIRTIYSMTDNITYQQLLGMNVLTIRL